MDCDGVLTDGRLYFTEAGEAMKVFHVRDGQGISLWHKAGFQSGIITARASDAILQKRMDELGVAYLRTRTANKLAEVTNICKEVGVTLDDVAFIGDDVGDLEVLKAVGYSAAPSDAHSSVREVVDHLTEARGGHGAVREIIDLLLAAKAES